MAERVLLTGISGFLGGHVTLALLNAGFFVRGSLRRPERADAIRQALARAGADTSRLDFVALDLLDDAGWAEAARDCRYMQHTASPFLIDRPRDRDVLIRPAVEGTRRAIAAGLAAGVERIVLTSSVAAIVYGHQAPKLFTEADWTDLSGPGVSAYAESKTRAEREAWALMDEAGRRDALAVINPAIILGPLLDDDPGTSAALVKRVLDGSVPMAPKMRFAFVDARDVAALHVLAMTRPETAGKRLIVAESEQPLMALVDALRAALPAYARRMPRREAPDWLLRLAGLFDPQIRDNLSELRQSRPLDMTRARALLGRPLIPAADAALATAQSLIAQKLV